MDASLRTVDTISIPVAFARAEGPLGWEAPFAAISDRGEVALGLGSVEYRLLLIGENGTPRVSGGRDIPRQPVSVEELAQMRATLDSLQRSRPPQREGSGPPPPLPDLPREIPHFTTGLYGGVLGFDGGGRLWVRTNRGRDSHTTIFDVFGPGLEYLGEIGLGFTVVENHIGATLLVASTVGDLGVQGVKVWRILEP
jgi:hypothetical protein